MTDADNVAAVVLAAGQSERFGPENKLLHTIDGKPIISHTVETVCGANVGEVIVVTGHDTQNVEDVITDASVIVTRNATPQAGMGTSLAAGANAIRSHPDAILVVLGDMPNVTPETLGKLITLFNPEGGHDIIVPVFEGRRGHPVLFGARYLPYLCALTGDTGARAVLRDHPERVRAVTVDDPGTIHDIDTIEDLKPPSNTP